MENRKARKLNLGCGKDIQEGYVNLDSAALPGVDIVHDIEKLPLPFSDNEFDEILCKDILEHVEYVPILGDIYRILKSGGRVKIKVPHFSSRNNFVDPTHKKLFSINTFDFFVKDTKRYHLKSHYLFNFYFSRSENGHISFRGARTSKLFLGNSLISRLVNKNKRRQILYEETALARIFPAENIAIDLIK